MSPIRPTKRRRLDNASHTLSQPFKSPFKTPLKSKPTTPNTDTANCSPSPTKKEAATNNASSLQSPPPPPLPHPTPITATPLRSTPSDQHHSPSSELLALQKRHTHLLNKLSAARSTLETSSQALKIESSPRDAELEALITKWRLASRAAAEEVYAGVRDRVNRMGGVGALRAKERESKERAWGWEEGPKVKREDGDEGEGEEDGAGFRGGEGEAGEREGRDGRDGRDEKEEGMRKAEEEGGDDDGYTIGMMLKSLNIEFGVIGYDSRLQKWVD
ncbi:hypothetical protein MMC28_010748 [Mycoblastus sanguinarius]|nr:hypothetical protein [Mycoblastus sanguinarius]